MLGTIVENYQITRRLASGGMGELYLATDLELDRSVAIKCLRPELTGNAELAERFRSEARTLARLDHPNIATIHRFFSRDDQLFLVMEYIDGLTFRQLVQTDGRLPAQRVISLVRQALEGLGSAHRNQVIHRDVKPSNLMLSSSGRVKVMDFGIAHLLGSKHITRTGMLVGTIAYLSPEQVKGNASDGRADLYSLSVVAYEMLTGQVPFLSDSEFEIMRAHVETAPPPPRTLAPDIPEALEQVILRGLSKEPRDRFASAELYSAALGIDPEETVLVRPGPPAPPRIGSGEWLRERWHEAATRIAWRSVAVVTCIALAGALAGWWLADRGEPSLAPVAAAPPAPLPAPTLASMTELPPLLAPLGPVEPFGVPPAPPAEPVVEVTPTEVRPEAPANAEVRPRPPPRQVAAKAPAAPRPATRPQIQVLKIDTHDSMRRKGLFGSRDPFVRAAGYNVRFRVRPGRGGASTQVDEVVEIRQGGSVVLEETLVSQGRSAGIHQSKRRIESAKRLDAGSYDVKLRLIADGKEAAQHRWNLQIQ